MLIISSESRAPTTKTRTKLITATNNAYMQVSHKVMLTYLIINCVVQLKNSTPHESSSPLIIVQQRRTGKTKEQLTQTLVRSHFNFIKSIHVTFHKSLVCFVKSKTEREQEKGYHNFKKIRSYSKLKA